MSERVIEFALPPFLAGFETVSSVSPVPFPVGTGSGICKAGAAPLQLETTGITSHQTAIQPNHQNRPFKSQAEFWKKQTIHKESIIAKLDILRRFDLTDKLKNCHQEAHYARCQSCKTVKVLLNRCDRFYCPECQPSLARDRLTQVEWWAREIKQPKHIVLTLQNLPTIDRATVLHAKSCLARLRRSKFCRSWAGGFYSLEVTNEKRGTWKKGYTCKGGWHIHFHLLVDVRYVDVRLLSLQWELATGGWGRIVKARDARGKDYLAEVTKYAVKGNQLACWSADDIACFIDAFSRVRTFGVFGSLYGKRTEYREWFKQVSRRQLTCTCGCCDFDLFTDLQWQLMKEGIPLHHVRGP